MNKKTFLLCSWVPTLTLAVIGCATFVTADSDKWIEYELPPSRINYSGLIIMRGQFSDGSNFHVLDDNQISSEDARFYYNILMQDFGWRFDGNAWSAPLSARDPRRGAMYINPRRRVAVYFHPGGDGGFDVFTVNIERQTI